MPKKTKKIPMRRCIACGVSKPQAELIRFTYSGSELKVDENKKSEGRGCYLCKDSECIERALKRNAFARSLKTGISSEEIENIRRYFNAK
jgi:predicted RNA-binding protein YlxR (DUF448 family)